MTAVLIGVSLFLIGGIISIFFHEKLKNFIFLFFAAVAQLFLLPQSFNVLLNGGQTEAKFVLSYPIGLCSFRLDPLAALFIIIISVGSLLCAVYSHSYMKMYASKKLSLSSYYFFLGILSVSMLLVVIAQNAIVFLIVWELMSISSFFLVSFENDKPEVLKSGLYYLISMQVGAAFLIAGFAWVSASSGSLDFSSFNSVLNNSNGFSNLIIALFLIGFGTKAGFIPMHTWLPKAHPAAPTGVSALMSGVMIKTGIYGILRVILLSGNINSTIAYTFFSIALLTAITGIANAASQKDLKKLLAYSSVENMGIIGMGLGIGMLGVVYNNSIIAMLGFLGALLHIVNHFTFKSLLFYGAGIVYLNTHTRNIDKLGGLAKYLPLTSTLFLIGSLAISGLPLFSGFISELLIYLGIAKSLSINNLSINIFAILGFSGLAFTGAIALLSFTKAYGIAFLGNPRTQYQEKIKKKDFYLLSPMIFLAVIIIMTGLFSYLTVSLLGNVLKQFLPIDSLNEFSKIQMNLKILSDYILIFISFILFFYFIRYLLLKRKRVENFKTWDCGYQKGSSRIQYTSSSFAQPFLSLISEIVPQKINVNKEPVLFPKEASIESNSQDFFERFLIQPNLKWLRKFLDLFSWIQSGKMQQYIVYGLIFLLFILIWILGVK